MDEITSAIADNETLSTLLSMLKKIIRAILPLIGLDMFTKYFEEDEEEAA